MKIIPMLDGEIKRFQDMAYGPKVPTYHDLRHACDNLKALRGGNYPPDWWEKIQTSGIYQAIMDRLNESSELVLETGTSEELLEI